MIYLYIKQHSITGLKYFGKTTKSNPFSYNGSGKYWQLHINKHGKEHIQTLDIYGFDNQDLCTEFALKFSKDNNIVESDKWANLREENGLDGLLTGHKFSDETKEKWSFQRKGLNNPFHGRKHSEEAKAKMSQNSHNIDKQNGMFGKKHKDSTKELLIEAWKIRKLTHKPDSKFIHHWIGKNQSEIHKKKIGDKNRGKIHPKIDCPHCSVKSSIANFKRWHGDNCKNKSPCQ